MSENFQPWVDTHLSRFEASLANFLPSAEQAPQRLHQAMRYATLDGGKRVRPLLVFAVGQLNNADVTRLDVVAAALELIHVFSLVHDDMPCMDDDVLRRGKPTCHVQYDEATALLVGDSLQTLAFQLLAEHKVSDTAETQLMILTTLAKASGSCGMAGGQAIDLESVGRKLTLPELELMHTHKTGALIRASIMMGAHCAGITGDTLARLEQFGQCIGLAFQVVDDILDHEADTETLGKTAGKDAEQDKPTYVSLLGLAASKEMAQKLHREALESLASLGEHANMLRALADFIVLRKF